MNPVDNLFNRTLSKIQVMAKCVYRVEYYSVGHHELVISIHDMLSTAQKHLVFSGVNYMSIVPKWQNSHLELVAMTDPFTIDLFEQLSISHKPSYRLVMAHQQQVKICIVSSLVHISDTFPAPTIYIPD
ncbi:MAG TPA: hypothetical protein VLL52_02255 [Anaerolineae bacterium]|nr:hypothetical protein [Anaerolineae bacterium]